MFMDCKEKLLSTLTICFLLNAKLTGKKGVQIYPHSFTVQYSLGMGDCYVLSVATRY